MVRKPKESSSVTYNQTDEHRRKKWKQNYILESSDEENNQDEEDDDSEIGESEWLIKCILEESESQYLIDWEGPWSPTWEPKENANDLAIKFWEEKKNKTKATTTHRKQKKFRGASPLTTRRKTNHYQLPSVRVLSVPIERVEHRSEQRQSNERSVSPLFVPFDVESESQDGNEIVHQSIQSKEELSVSNSLKSGVSPNTRISSSKQLQSQTFVFDFVAASPIPPEYRLSDEPEESVQIATQATADPPPSTVPPSVISDTQKSNGVQNPETPKEPARPRFQIEHTQSRAGPQSETTKSNNPTTVPPSVIRDIPKSNGLQHPETPKEPPRPKSIQVEHPQSRTHPQSETFKSIREVDEIAETPPAPPTVLASISLESRAKPLDSQLSFQSPFSHLVTQAHLSSGSGSTGALSIRANITTLSQAHSIPETVPNSSQCSVNSRSQFFDRLSKLSAKRFNTTMNEQSKKDTQPSADTMDKYSHIEGSTPREKIRNAYAQLRAKPNSNPLHNDASATPSSAGDIEPSAPIVPKVAAPLSVRVEKESASHPAQSEVDTTNTQAESFVPPAQAEHPPQPIQTIQPSALTVSQVEEAPPGSVQLGPSEFAIPLPMDSRVRDDYEQVLVDDSGSIRDYVNATDPKQQKLLEPKMKVLLERLSNVATHPDLNITEHIKNTELELENEAAWAEYSSAKFSFLGHLVKIADSHNLHLVIMVRGEKTVKILERYLLGKGLRYTRARPEMGDGTGLELSMVKGSLSLGIQSTSSDGIVGTYKSPSAIIAFDTSFNAKSPSVEHMRTTFARNGNLLPIIRLLVSNTSEHIERCFPGSLRSVMQYTVRLRNIVGDLQDDALGVHEDAEEVLTSILPDNFHWQLPLVEPLRILTPEELDSPELGSSSSTSQDQDTNAESATFPTPPVQKRAFEVGESGEQASKRQRMDTSQETSQFTESSKFPSQTLDGDLQALEKNIVQMKTSHAAELVKLQKALSLAQTRLQEREKSLEELQHRYETRTRDIHQIRRERDSLAQSKTASEQRVEKQKEEIVKLKDDRTQLRHELERAREALKTGGGGAGAAELEAAQEEIRRLNKANEGLERKSDYEKRQAEYTREQYQNASNVAAQSGNENRQLREENENMKRKVAGDAIRLREINKKNDESRHLSRVAELEATLASRDDLLRKKEDELREIRKNRPSTRSTSTQPRSPKWAANSRPTSPGLNNNGFSGRGSALRFSSEMSL